MIDNYLRELVQNNHRVIIPDFGAFLKKDKDATILENAVTFSPFLRFNDGLLEDYLVEKKLLTKEEASAKVRQYVQNVKQTLAEQRPYYVDDLGAFYADERGAVQFLYAETEKEALSKFEEAMAAQANLAFMPDVEVKAPATPLEILEPAAEEKKKAAKKKVVEVVSDEEEEEEEEEDDDVIEPEVVKTVNVRGRKKAGVKEIKKKDNMVSKTVINVNVNTDNGNDVNAKEKEKQLEVANESLQNWMRAVEERKGQQKALNDQEQTSQEEEAKRHREEEVARAIAEKKRRDEEEAQRRAEEEANERPPVWEEGVMKRRRGRGAILLLAIIALVLASAASLWYWDEIQEVFGWDEPDVIETEETVISPPVRNEPVFTPKVLAQQPNMYYVVVASFTQQQTKDVMAMSRLLYADGYIPEVVIAGGNKFLVSIGKYSTANEARVKLGMYSQKHEQKYGKGWILP